MVSLQSEIKYYSGRQRPIFAKTFSVDDFGIYDRLHREDNKTSSQLVETTSMGGVAIKISHSPLQF